MIKFDFNNMIDKFIDKENFNNLVSRKEEVYSKFNEAYMTGWTQKIEKKEISNEITKKIEVQMNFY